MHSAKQRFRKVGYPLREGTLLRLRECVNDIRENVSLAIDILQLKVTVNIQDELEDTARILATIKVDHVSSQVLKWLKAPDPTQNYNNACEKRHPKTGLWLIQNYTFLQWLQREPSFLWVYRAVGCGLWQNYPELGHYSSHFPASQIRPQSRYCILLFRFQRPL